jgi:hypothetical protein
LFVFYFFNVELQKFMTINGIYFGFFTSNSGFS